MTDPRRCRDCNAPAAPGKSRCATHLARMVEYAARARARRQARGSCSLCDAPPAEGGRLCEAHRAMFRESSRRRYAANPEAERARQRARDPEERRAAQRTQRAARIARGECESCNTPAVPGLSRCETHAEAHRRRTAARKVKRVIERWEDLDLWRCRYCDADLDEGMHIDHRLARARGGSDDVGNLDPSCPGCNLSKSDRPLSEFLDEMGMSPFIGGFF